METKPCSKCKRVLPLSRFVRKRYQTKRGPKLRWSSQCGDCNAAYTAAWRERNPEYLAALNERQKRERKKRRRQLANIKTSLVCSECGQEFIRMGEPGLRAKDRQRAGLRVICSGKCQTKRATAARIKNSQEV